MSIYNLPPEIVDCILEFLVETAPDRHSTSLTQGSLVCRAFRSTSQRLLFRSISLRALIAHHILQVIDILHSNPDTFGSYVQKLTLTPMRWRGMSAKETIRLYPNDTEEENSPLNTFILLVPNLKSLCIDGRTCTWDTFPSRMKEHVEGILKGTIPNQVEALELQHIPCFPPKLFLSASRIKAVTIAESVQVKPEDLSPFHKYFDDGGPSPSRDEAATDFAVSLRSLNFRSLYYPVKLFTAVPSILATLTTLSMNIAWSGDDWAAQFMVDACHRSLQTLDVRWKVRHSDWDYNNSRALDLSRCKSLKHLKLQMNGLHTVSWGDPEVVADPRPLGILVDSLASISSPSLVESVRLAMEGSLPLVDDGLFLPEHGNPTLFLHPMTESVKGRWDDLDEILSSSTKFPALRNVDLDYSLEATGSALQGEMTGARWEDGIRRCCAEPASVLPRTRKRYKVHIASYFNVVYA
ncbi:hypothetical protein CC2G_003498 [Coprinopsis cinerea AmutBmut pab1-1]|nr:hypothetical protein CC2G_003498 [Coprinopsis cinerea AmutBmut pab1-1]